MEYKTLIFEKEGGVCTITLNRPDRLNTINNQLTEELVIGHDISIECD